MIVSIIDSCRPNPWFSTFYILVGASLIAVILTKVGMQLEESASQNMWQALKQREEYEHKMSRDNSFCARAKAFVQYNGAYLFTVSFYNLQQFAHHIVFLLTSHVLHLLFHFLQILIWLFWLAFIVVWSMISTSSLKPGEEWDFSYAIYFSVSLCSSAGSFSLPIDSQDWAYLLAAISMLVGVPLMALAISGVVLMLWQGHKFQQVKEAAWGPISTNELNALDTLGLLAENSDEITKGGFILLGLMRMGQDGGIINYLSNVYEANEQRGGVLLNLDGDHNGFYSDQARAFVGSDEECSKNRQTNKQHQWSVIGSSDGLASTTGSKRLDSLGVWESFKSSLTNSGASSNIRSTTMRGSESMAIQEPIAMEPINETGLSGTACGVISDSGVPKAKLGADE